jgi:hypothetical protein
MNTLQYPGLDIIGYYADRITLPGTNILIDPTLAAKHTDAPSN